ncbi:DUF507 family protein [Campylobacter corcagiensis]|uniref:DUF507 family protein n=1 Tax=Campylobacter corcagiensis TaxID=1448857 RepID=A0A7M1LE19_9BACT|nr:DUF507 family protein [Campylobacter corcagiensis]QKF65297.1 DUF507 domain-containing protein [Campylobacter corcagiensis]QOQ86571.1 DUF507 family protein [Campylobacter corcagiensis]
MRIKNPHIPYVARKIAIDMLNSGFIKFSGGIESVADVANSVLLENAQEERALDERTNELLEENEDDMESLGVDRRNIFWMVKRRLAEESGFILSHEDRYNALSHAILELAWKKNLIDYSVSENRAKNIIYQAIADYLKNFEEIEDIVADKIANGTRKLIPGTDEYDLVFEKMYQDELRKRGAY